MKRLTTDKNVSDMGMVELAHNCCYAKDGKARYRDFDMDMDARDFARNLMTTLTDDELPLDDDNFDEEILENLQYDPFADVTGLIALFYRNLWAMADLRERLKAYEDTGLSPEKIKEISDMFREKCEEVNRLKTELTEYQQLEEQGLLLRLPYPLETKILYFANKDRDDVLDIDATTLFVSKEDGKVIYEYDGFRFHLEHFGKTVFLTEVEAEQALKQMRRVSVMRLIDADAWINVLENISVDTDIDEETRECAKSLIRANKDRPTAYDVDAVVEQIKELSIRDLER